MGVKSEISVCLLEICTKSGLPLVSRVLHREEEGGPHPPSYIMFKWVQMVHLHGPQWVHAQDRAGSLYHHGPCMSCSTLWKF